MRMRRRDLLARLTGLLCALPLAALPTVAHAQSAEDLRRSGQAGERFDGYMEVRESSVASVVAQINAQRREVYQRRAQEQGVSVDQVGRVFAQEIIRKAAVGTWIRDAGGNWSQK